jgi:hypothetical protein
VPGGIYPHDVIVEEEEGFNDQYIEGPVSQKAQDPTLAPASRKEVVSKKY